MPPHEDPSSPAIVRGRVGTLTIHQISDGELDQLAQGSPVELYLNLSIFLLGVALSFLGSMLTDPPESQTARTVFIVITTIGFIVGGVLLALWIKGRKSTKQLVQIIRARLPSPQEQNAATVGELDEVKKQMMVQKAIQNGLAVKGEEFTNNDRRDAITELEAALTIEPSNRKAINILANLYAQLDNHPMALTTSTRGIEALKVDPKHTEKDLADVYYNRAAYYADLYKKGKDKAENRKKMLEDLRESVRLSDFNKKEAHNDKDFLNFLDDSDFQAITKAS